MKFKKIENITEAIDVGVVYLIYDYWDDYGYCTRFNAYYKRNSKDKLEKIGLLKIGCESLSSKVEESESKNGYSSYSVENLISTEFFNDLSNSFFSLGQDINYYKKVNDIFGDKNTEYYEALNDLGYDYERFNELYNNHEPSLINSLMRSLYTANVQQFNRISKGEAELTKYSFNFKYRNEKINIEVIPNSLPPSNIHILIGRNGVGKTWLLHNMLLKLLKNGNDCELEFEKSQKYDTSDEFSIDAPKNSFAGVVGVSFSVFDDALSLEIKDSEKITDKKIDDFKKIYKYIGLISKNEKDGKSKTKSVDDLAEEFISFLENIKKNKNKIETYIETCKYLDNDSMFRDNQFIKILEKYFNEKEIILFDNKRGNEYSSIVDNTLVKKFFRRLSSGHMIIILSLTALVDSVHEKTIVLIDEPETHLHPPLLSNYIRTLSFLLLKKNAIAIIATHSPIVIQEVPKSCVNRITRDGDDIHFEDVILETFATNTDSLTREIFGLEVIKTGFYQLLQKELESNFDETFQKFEGKVGSLGQILIQSLLSQKRSNDEEN
ncbi:AAA family ATPase [Clostridium perfringens]|uniref:AAA family ATPase n=1 Tax=Clostridium perfringens TaxID=1502 RepID=UPI0024BC0EDB|nr:AAA family ATPase [Clostridium perfringens]MDT7918703.1 AAA family ATPase [Clostridium perfringens]MDT7938313.1 AAA family ATPase [Clostridium perfringens]MDT7941460.1 AAA family ATPase [Clostridium perfringens]MDT7967452.1 AAA family ATPase [Clostridium perfringens]MDT7992127.1 AAA family ATPase [Clostridium perfringens]